MKPKFMKKKNIYIFLTIFLIMAVGVIYVFNQNLVKRTSKSSPSHTGVTSKTSKKVAKSSKKTKTSETLTPTDEQKQDEENVKEIGQEEINKAREELKSAHYNPTDFSGADLARYLKKAKDEGKTLLEVVKEDGVEP